MGSLYALGWRPAPKFAELLALEVRTSRLDEQREALVLNIYIYIYIYLIYIYIPIGSMYGIYANIWGILMVNVTIYSIHGSYGICIYIYIYIY